MEMWAKVAESGLAAGLAVGGYAYAGMWPGSQIFGRTLTAPGLPSELALTFDDGPNPKWTPKLLEVLARYEVKATFFLIGQFAAQNKALVREMQAAGHVLGNHTWTHPNLARTGPGRTREELARTKREIEGITGAPVRLFRPPFGGRSPWTGPIARGLGMEVVLWNAMTADWDATEAEPVAAALLKKIGKNRRAGRATNLVLHDGSHRMPEAERGASVGAVGRILAARVANVRMVTVGAWVG